MKILVYPHLMEIGGSQLNAIELGGRLQQRGHSVVVFAPAGDLIPLVGELGMDLIKAPRQGSWPSFTNIVRLLFLVHQHKFDVVHGYEWGPSLDLAFGPHLLRGIPLVTTVMSMSVPAEIPRDSALIVGTAALAREQRTLRPRVHLMEPPIDTQLNAPADNEQARKNLGFYESDVVIAVICRLTTDLDKLQGVFEALEATLDLAKTLPVKLLVVGDGPGLAPLRSSADSANAHAGREVISITGGILDPRDAYCAADIVLGMGSSAMKGMAYAKPLVVQGSAGFWELLDESSLATFLEQGWYGNGGGGSVALSAILRPLIDSAERRADLGQFGRTVVTQRFSLDAAADQLCEIYEDAARSKPTRMSALHETIRVIREVAKFKIVMFSRAATRQLKAALHE